MINRFRMIAVVAISVLVSSGAAQAALVSTGVACSLSSVSGSTACSGIWEGNDSNQDLSNLFGQATWTEVVKLDPPTGTATRLNLSMTIVNNGATGTWALGASGYAGLGPVMFVTKGGPTFSAFLMDLNVLSGTWDTQSMLKGNGKPGPGLSHFTVYSAGQVPPPPPVVPLPAAGWLMIAGIAGLGAMRRRKTKA